MNRGGFISAFALILLAVAIVAGIVVVQSSRPQAVEIRIIPPQATTVPGPTATPGPILVYVTGAVAQPDTLMNLMPGARVQDALSAAGGITENADLSRVNLAAVLHDGDQIHVPAIEEAEVVLATPQGGQIVHINTASAVELEALPGAGPALAQAIVAYRDVNGAFGSVEELDPIEGVGVGLIERWRGLIAFD